jgi:carboxypeptidase Taq
MSALEAYVDLKNQMKEVAILNSTENILHWDKDLHMPAKSAEHRGDQLAQIMRLSHEWFTDAKVDAWLSEIESSDLMEDYESEVAVNVREWRRMYDRETKLPKRLVEDFARVTTKAGLAWIEARKKSDFTIFQSHLQHLVDLNIEMAECFGYETEVYDALLAGYEPGARSADVETAFAGLRTDLVELIGKIKDAPRKPDIGILKRPWDVEKQKLLAQIVAAAMGYDFEIGRLDEAVHPYMTEMGPYDVRILTRYYPNDLAEGLSGTIHEAGHALYYLTKANKEHWGTPLFETASLAIHESQSRTWENIVARSREFWVYFFPQLQRMFPKESSGITLDEFYGAMNYVSPSYIRVEADEATYNLHIMLRFEIERAIISGDLAVKDIPGEWNKRFKDYLGIEVDSDANGCLQDIHWSHASFGYFPTYALGNLYAAQFWVQAKKDLPGLMDDFTVGKFDRLYRWLGEKIHAKGATYYAADLCKRLTGEPLSHKPLLDYLYDKYEGIYGISRD